MAATSGDRIAWRASVAHLRPTTQSTERRARIGSLRPAIFFDRDGTLAEEVGYAHRPEQFHIYPGAAAAVRRVNEAGWAAVLVTNQAGIARGMYPVEDMERLHALLAEHLAAHGAHLDAIYYCPHHPDFGAVRDCDCRKPKPGLLRQAAQEHDLDLPRSWVIGDKRIDIEMARAVGARAALVLTGYGAHISAPLQEADVVAVEVAAAVDAIFAREAPHV